MLRVISSLLGIPVLLAVLLALALDAGQSPFVAVTTETFELGILPVVIAIALVMLLIFLPLLGLSSRITRVSWWSAATVGFLSALLPLAVSAWPFLADSSLRIGFRVERLADSYPWLALGAIGGLLFWLLAVFRNPTLGQHLRKP